MGGSMGGSMGVIMGGGMGGDMGGLGGSGPMGRMGGPMGGVGSVGGCGSGNMMNFSSVGAPKPAAFDGLDPLAMLSAGPKAKKVAATRTATPQKDDWDAW